jgi:hypothetical protein
MVSALITALNPAAAIKGSGMLEIFIVLALPRDWRSAHRAAIILFTPWPFPF